jgi:hypothetical protein
LRDGDPYGVVIFKGPEMDAVGAVLGQTVAIGSVGELEAVVEVAERTLGEGDGAAFLAGGLDVAAEGCSHGSAFLETVGRTPEALS